MRNFILGLLLLVTFSLYGCGLAGSIEDGIDKGLDVADKAVEVIDRGITDISNQSETWQSVLQRVATELPQEVSDDIRNDAQNLATRSIATAGVEFRCDVDFLGARAIASLQRLKAEVLHKDVAPLPPAFCQVSPDSIDLNSPPEKWNKVTIQGYDLDHTDAAGKELAFYLLEPSGQLEEISKKRIGRTTPYQVTLGLDDYVAQKLYTDNISKIVSSWEAPDGESPPRDLPEIVVLGWQPKFETVTYSVESTDYMPPKINGDGNFNTHDDEYMSVKVQGEYTISRSEILSRVYMNAKEERSDWTEVDGWSDQTVAYQAPKGWVIDSVRPGVDADDSPKTVTSTHTANITEHDKQTYSRPGGEIVQTFEVWGDRDGDEAGTWTHVKVNWRPIEVRLRQIKPTWVA